MCMVCVNDDIWHDDRRLTVISLMYVRQRSAYECIYSYATDAKMVCSCL